MLRRSFMGLVTMAGAAGGVAKLSHASGQRRIVRYQVAGFTCPTCALGLETLLEREKGILKVNATYPQAVATVSYDAALIQEPAIRAAIESSGFKALLLAD